LQDSRRISWPTAHWSLHPRADSPLFCQSIPRLGSCFPLSCDIGLSANGPLTWSAWVSTSSSASQNPILARGYQGSQTGYELTMQSGKFTCAVRDSHGSTTVTTSNTYNDSKWHFVACEFVSAGTVSVWIDGTQSNSAATAVQSVLNTNSTVNLYLCKDDGPNYCTAKIADAIQWNTALSSAMMKIQYNSYPSPVEVTATQIQYQAVFNQIAPTGSSYPQYVSFTGSPTLVGSTLEGLTEILAPNAGIIHNLRVYKTYGSCAITITLRVNGANSGPTLSTTTSTSATSSVSDTTDVVVVSQGNLLDWQVNASGCSSTNTLSISVDVSWEAV